MHPFLDILKKGGNRITQPRKIIFEALLKTPSSAQEIFVMLQKRNMKADLVTVYRTLELFKRLGIVSKTQFADNVARFEVIIGQEHHHHLICKECKTIEDVTLNEKHLVEQVTTVSKFKVHSHALEFFGLCADCQK